MNRNKLSAAIHAAIGVTTGKIIPVWKVPDPDGSGEMLIYPYQTRKLKMSVNKRWLNNFIAVCVVVVFLAILLVTAGCAGQGVKLDVETANDKCGTKNVKFSTDYQVEQLEIGRTIEGGGTDGDGSEGCGGGYTVKLGKGTTKDAELGIITELMQMVRVLVGGGTLAPQVQGQSMTPPAGADAIFKAGIEEGRKAQTRAFNGSISGTQFKVDGAGNVWIDGKINPKLPLKQD